jgi:hypothetical protein
MFLFRGRYSPSNIRVPIKCFPEVIQAIRTRPSPNIEQDADIRLQNRTKRIEEPPMRVDFLLIVLLHEEDDLRGNDPFVRILEVQIWINTNCQRTSMPLGYGRKEHTATGVFKHVCLDWHSINHIFHVFTLVDSQSSETVKYAWMNASSTIGNDADYDLLPAIWSPDLARFPRGKMGNVLHYAVQGAAEENFVLLIGNDEHMSRKLKLHNTHIVHRDNDEEFSLTTMFDLSKTEALLHKVIGIAGDGGIPRLFHFFESLPW